MGLLDPLFNHVLSGFGVQPEDPQGALLSEFLRLPQQPAQAQAQPTGHMMPQAPAQQPQPMAPPAPNFLDRLSAMSRGYGEGGLVGGIADAFNLGDSRGERAQAQQRNATFEYLVPKVGEEAARAAMGNPELLKQVLKTVPGARSDEYSKNLVYGTDKDGNTIPLQAGTAGDLVASKMPDGISLNAKPQQHDLGDRIGIFDPATRTYVQFIPKGLGEAERLKHVGEAQGKAQVNLPQVESAAARMLKQIDELEMDPSLESITGFIGGRIPAGYQTEGMANAQSRLNQISGGTFLQAYNELRGGGAITEAEGAQAKASYSRLGTQTMGTPAYRKALQEAREETLKLVELAKRKAAGLGGTPAAPTAPSGPRRTSSGVTWEPVD
jgi:hypothetical protein